MKRHLLISYHTCPTERPGRDLAGGMNVLLHGFLRHTTWPTDVVTRSFGDYERIEIRPGVTVHRLPCEATRPWTREKAWECLEPFRESLRQWLEGRHFDVARAHYWMSGTLLSELDCPAGMIFHTLQIQKGPPSDPLETFREEQESRIAERYPTAFLHWHDLKDATARLEAVRGSSIVRPGIDADLIGEVRADRPPTIFGWAARNDAIKNFDEAKARLTELRESVQSARLRVAGMDGEPRSEFEFLGPLAPEEMASFYSGIDQLWNFSRYETFGLSVLEGIAQGATVGLAPNSDWAKRLKRLGIDSTPGRTWTREERRKALELAKAYTWERALPSWEHWLAKVSDRAR